MKKSTKKDQILQLFNKNADITSREFKVEGKTIYLFFIDCLIDDQLVSQGILDAIKNIDSNQKSVIETLEKSAISIGKVTKISDKSKIPEEVFNASVVIAVEGEENYLSIASAGYSTRSVSEPPTSSVVRGPREGFIEDLEINLSLIRRRLKTPTLAIKRLSVGERSATNIALVYLDDIADNRVVKKLEKTISEIKIDGILDSYFLEEMLEESQEKFFKKLGNSEKPDVIASRIMEGRIAIVVDGSPIVLTAPFLLLEELQSPGDYYDIPSRSSFTRILRVLGLLLAILLPGMYVALQSFHYRVLPINFLISLLSSIEGISFPPILEILFVLFLFEILSEASVRMPKQLGMALSIIGALVLGDTAVQAGIITPPSIVVVAISGITLYIIPNQASEASLLRTLFTVIGGFSGFYGIFIGFLILCTYLVSIQSYGAPYLAPFAPLVSSDKKDTFIKVPLNQMRLRPKSFYTKDLIREKNAKNNQKESAIQEK